MTASDVVIRRATEADVPSIVELRVASANPASARFWRRLGFRPYLEALWQEVGPAPGGLAGVGTQDTVAFALSQWEGEE